MEQTKTPYARPIDAIVLAGTDSNPRRMIGGQNKAFLDVGGEVLVNRVVRALMAAETIGEVFIVGPRPHLQEVLGGLVDKVHIVQQVGGLLANGWEAIRASESHHAGQGGVVDPHRPMLFISCDLPLISSEAVNDFVSRCALEDDRAETPYALHTGVADEVSLRPFYGDEKAKGIHRPYVNFSDCRLRLANIYVGRPRALKNHTFLETGFEHRKAEKLKNVAILTWKFLGQHGGWKAAWITLRLQLTLIASRRPGRVYRWLRSRNLTSDAEKSCSEVLGGAVRIIITPYGGLSLDIDNEEDFLILSDRFHEWTRIGPVERET